MVHLSAHEYSVAWLRQGQLTLNCRSTEWHRHDNGRSRDTSVISRVGKVHDG